MQKIVINNFGPISSCELSMNDIMIFIGEQASGKSTICKCVYFFKAMRDDIFAYLVESINARQFDKIPRVINKRNRRRYLDFFGSSRHLDRTFLRFQYSPNNYVELSLSSDDKNITTNYSAHMLTSLKEIEEKAKIFSEELYEDNNDSMSLQTQLAQKRAFYNEIRSELNQVFFDDRELAYIPAGRSLLSLLSDQLSTISIANLDYITGQFLRMIQEEKKSFKDGIDELVLTKRQTTIDPINRKMVELAKVALGKVLKGEYRYDTAGERILLGNRTNKFVRINYASSGQHEAIWILYLLFSWILNQKKMFVVIEEPEAHLFPVAQRDLINLIALFASQNDNQVMITTHSPYILTSVNNLMYANRVGQTKEAQVSQIINKAYWLNAHRVSAYLLGKEGNNPQPIIERETGLVNAEKIDSISEIVNKEYLDIYNLED